MPFLIFSSADRSFLEQKLNQKSYTAIEALPTTKQMKLIDKKEFTKAAFDKQLETFVVYVVALEALLLGMTIHPLRVAQIFDSDAEQVAALK